MKIQTTILKSALDKMRSLVGRKASLPILSCVKLHTERNRLHITASNLDEYMVERVECSDEIEPCCVNYQKLCNAIGGDETELKFSDGAIAVKIKSGITNLKTLLAEDFPSLPKDELIKSSVACDELSKAVDNTAWAASTDETRFIFNAVHISASPKMLRVEATDARNLAFCEIPLMSSEFEAIVPRAFAANFSAALLRSESELSIGKNYVRVSHEWGNYFCKQLDGKYPDTAPIIRATPKFIGEAKTAELLEIVGRCDSFSDPSRTPVAMVTFSKSGAQIDFVGQDSSLAHKASGQFEPHECRLNANSFKTCLGAINSETVRIHAGGSGNFKSIVLESGNLFIHSTECTDKA